MRSPMWLLAMPVVGAVACSHGGATAPAWPKPYVAADAHDGGESLAPRAASSEIAELEDSDDDLPTFTPTPTAAPVATPTTTPAATVTPIAPATEAPIMTEDITIEVDE